MATVTINGKEITVEDGTLILDAARQAGFEIPTFCYQAELSRLGSCRMCLVEIEGQRKLQPSCVTPVMHGMNIWTDSPSVVSAREAMLEFLLSNHALDCPVCDKGGECELQDMVYKYGPRKGRFQEVKNRFHDRDYVLSPVIVKNSNRCVQCMRCVRVCREVVGVGVLGAIGRGHKQEETSFLRQQLDCDHDGNCIEVCPVGCFMRRPYRYKARPWDLTRAMSICPYCGTGCRFSIQERDGVVLRAVAMHEVGVNGITLCARGRFGYDFVNSKERLKTPLVKRNGRFEPVTWHDAMEMIKERLGTLQGERIGAIASPRLTNEELFLFQRFVREVLKSPNIDSDPRWNDTTVEAFVSVTGIPEGGTSLFDCVGADTVFIIGGQVSEENPVVDYTIRRISSERRMNIIIGSPRAMKLDASAGILLRHGAGCEDSLLIALACILTEESGLQDGKALLGDLSKEGFIEQAGVAEDDLRACAKVLVGSNSIGIFAGTSLLRFSSLRGLHLLRTVLERLKKALFIMPLLDRCNQRGAWDMGVHPGFGPGYRGVERRGLGCDGMLEGVVKGEIDALYIVGEDLVSAYPDGEFVESALSKAGFVVVQDAFLTRTARFADVVLPSAVFAEKDGTFTNQEGRVQAISKLLPPPGEAKTDLEIISILSAILGGAFDRTESKEVFDTIKETIDMYRDVELRDEPSQVSLVKGSGAVFRREEPPFSKVVYGEDREYPFVLITGNHLFHSGTFSLRSDILCGLLGEGIVEMNREDAESLGVSEGEKVRVRGRGYEAFVKVRIRKDGLRGVVFVPENFEDTPVNRFLKRGEKVARVSIQKPS